MKCKIVEAIIRVHNSIRYFNVQSHANDKRYSCVWATDDDDTHKKKHSIDEEWEEKNLSEWNYLPFETDMNHYSQLVDNSNCNLSTIQPLDAKNVHMTQTQKETKKVKH